MSKEMALVVVDSKTLEYRRYSGRTNTHKFTAKEVIDKYWVEQIRVNPETFISESEDPLIA